MRMLILVVGFGVPLLNFSPLHILGRSLRKIWETSPRPPEKKNPVSPYPLNPLFYSFGGVECPKSPVLQFFWGVQCPKSLVLQFFGGWSVRNPLFYSFVSRAAPQIQKRGCRPPGKKHFARYEQQGFFFKSRFSTMRALSSPRLCQP